MEVIMHTRRRSSCNAGRVVSVLLTLSASAALLTACSPPPDSIRQQADLVATEIEAITGLDVDDVAFRRVDNFRNNAQWYVTVDGSITDPAAMVDVAADVHSALTPLQDDPWPVRLDIQVDAGTATAPVRLGSVDPIQVRMAEFIRQNVDEVASIDSVVTAGTELSVRFLPAADIATAVQIAHSTLEQHRNDQKRIELRWRTDDGNKTDLYLIARSGWPDARTIEYLTTILSLPGVESMTISHNLDDEADRYSITVSEDERENARQSLSHMDTTGDPRPVSVTLQSSDPGNYDIFRLGCANECRGG